MAQKKSRQTFEKLKREQAIREKRVRKQERKAAARLALTARRQYPYRWRCLPRTAPSVARVCNPCGQPA